VKTNENLGLIREAQKLVDAHYDKTKEMIMDEKKINEKHLKKRLESFKEKLKNDIDTDKMSDLEIYKLARSLVIKNIKKGLTPLAQNLL
jgi:hypothetical protein